MVGAYRRAVGGDSVTPTIGQRIRIVRKSQLIGLVALGKKVGYNAATISEIERDRAPLPLEKFLLICQALHITAEDIWSDDWRKRCERGGISLEEPIA